MNIGRILTTQEGPGAVRTDRATGEEFGGGIAKGLMSVAQGLSDVGQEAERVAYLDRVVKEKQKRIDDTNKALSLAEEAETEFAVVQQELRATPSSEIMDLFKQRREEIRQRYGQRAAGANPEVAQYFERHFIAMGGKYERTTVDLKNQKWLDETVRHLDGALDYIIDKAATSGPFERDTWISAGIERIDWHVKEGVITGVKGEQLKQILRSSIKMRSIQNDAMSDPFGTLTIFKDENKRTAMYGEMTVEEIIKAESLIMTQISHNVTQEDRDRINRERQEKEVTRLIKKDLVARIMKGENVTAAVATLTENNMLHDAEDAKWVLGFQSEWLKRLGDDSVTDDEDVKGDIVKRLYGLTPTVSEGELYSLWRAKKLKTSTYQTFLGHLTSRHESIRRENEGEIKTDRNRAFSSGQKSLNMFFQVEGQMAEFVDRDVKEMHSNAVMEYYGLVYEDGIDPNKAVNVIKNRYGRSLQSKYDADSVQLRQTLPVPDSVKREPIGAVAAHLERVKGTMPSATWRSAVSLLRRIQWLEESRLKKQDELVNIPKENEKK